MENTLSAEDLVFSQGHGDRRHCRYLLGQGLVEIRPQDGEWRVLLPDEKWNPRYLWLRVQGEELPWLREIHIALNKPVHYECSHAPSHHPSVFHLLPRAWVNRGLRLAGRLDADTTGLILLSTDGDFIHALTSPKRHLPKVYRVTHAQALSDADREALAKGIILRGETRPTLPSEVEALGSGSEKNATKLTIYEGRYHQVKRMFAALGHKVDSLHREKIGSLALDENLLPGKWRLLSSSEIQDLQAKTSKALQKI